MKDTQRNALSIIMKIVIAVASALLGALGGVEAMAMMNN